MKNNKKSLVSKSAAHAPIGAVDLDFLRNGLSPSDGHAQGHTRVFDLFAHGTQHATRTDNSFFMVGKGTRIDNAFHPCVIYADLVGVAVLENVRRHCRKGVQRGRLILLIVLEVIRQFKISVFN